MGWLETRGRVDVALETNARIGATPDNDIAIRIAEVSKSHARILREGDTYWLEDAGSRNGTWLNGERVARARLQHLDVITLGRSVDLVFVGREREQPAATEAFRVELEWTDKPAVSPRLPLGQGEWLVGRAESNQICLDDSAISRVHARVVVTAVGATIEDLGSVNGTFVNEQRLDRPVALRDGDRLDFGHGRSCRVKLSGSPTPVGIAPVPSADADMEWKTRIAWTDAVDALPERVDGQGERAGSQPQAPSPTPPAGVEGPVQEHGRTSPADMRPSIEPPLTQLLGGTSTPVMPPSLADSSSPEDEAGEHTPAADATQRGGDRELATPDFLDEGSGATPGTSVTPPSLLAPPDLERDEGRTSLDIVDAAGPPLTVLPNALPPDTVLGFRDVPAPIRPPTSLGLDVGVSAGPAGGQSPHELDARPIESVRLTGDYGAFTLSAGVSTVGRSADATLRIESQDVSRVHATFTVTDTSVVLEDRQSANGSFVNGAAVTGPRILRAGDRVGFADFQFRIDILRKESDE